LNQPPLLYNFAARDAELNQLKMLVKQLADKVNAPRDTPAGRIAAVEDRVDDVALHGVRLGTTLGLAAMATHTAMYLIPIGSNAFQTKSPSANCLTFTFLL
jgi:hypothetical protein